MRADSSSSTSGNRPHSVEIRARSISDLRKQFLRGADIDRSSSSSLTSYPSATINTFHKLVGHWRNPHLTKCFNLWNWDCKICFKRAVRSGRCQCGRDGNFRFSSRVNPEVVLLCDCETCSSSSQPSAVAIFDYSNKDLLALDGATVLF